jgi:hypothetical protein
VNDLLTALVLTAALIGALFLLPDEYTVNGEK